MSRNYDDIRGNLVDRFDATSSYDRVTFFACQWTWASFGKPGQVWVSGPIYLKSGNTAQRQRSEKLVALKDLSPANATVIYQALAEHWGDQIADLQARRQAWRDYFIEECEQASVEALHRRVADMAERQAIEEAEKQGGAR